jgi:hypothetical protein
MSITIKYITKATILHMHLYNIVYNNKNTVLQAHFAIAC